MRGLVLFWGCSYLGLRCHSGPKVGSPLLNSKPVVRLTPHENFLLFTRWSVHGCKRAFDKAQHRWNIQRTRRQHTDLVDSLHVLWRSFPKFLTAEERRRSPDHRQRHRPTL